MPESVTDRPTKAHEMIYLLTKSARYYYDNEAVREAATDDYAKGGRVCLPDKVLGKGFEVRGNLHNQLGKSTRNLRSVWNTKGNGYALVELPDDTTDEMTTVFNIATRPFSEAHFATFPLEIPLRCIKAGTSERGECPHCGKAWVRVVETSRKEGRDKLTCGNMDANGITRTTAGLSVPNEYKVKQSTTIGFTPQCQCPAHEPVHQTVLDPFNGAATTGVAALLLNRNYIGFELNPDYLEISRKRLQNYAIEMPDEIEQPKVIKTQLAMF